jgi:RNase H-fold protein (predicted Holliday junction resolvase)
MTQRPHDPTTSCVLAIDPGRSKCGLAVVDRLGHALHREIVSTLNIPSVVTALTDRFSPEAVVVGDGTGSASLIKALAAVSLSLSVVKVDEKHTSELARARFLKENPARGLERLIPGGLRTPNVAYDDYVAIILAERWIALRDEG